VSETLDNDVGISDNLYMVSINTAVATPTQPESTLGSAAARPDPTAIVFDIQSGMPLTRAAGLSMGLAAVRTALGKAVESLPGRRGGATASILGSAGTAPLDSLEVVWLLAKFDRLFDKPLLDLTKVPASRWSTIDAVASLVHESMGTRR
jgi:hypothetical protein